MLRLGIAACLMAALAFAEEFSFTIGSPVAAQDFRAKTAAFVFRTQGCPDPSKAQISASAEGLVKGARRSVALKVDAMSRPGVYAVYQSWPSGGQWVVNLRGTCNDANAGAIVPIGPKGFVRESAKFFPRAATHVEIEASLKALSQSDNKGENK
jgi:hypothetical protein